MLEVGNDVSVRKFEKYVVKGVNEPLSAVPFHGHAPVDRLMMLNQDMIEDCDTRISVHMVNDLPDQVDSYCEMHKHDFDEINIIVSQDKGLTYSIQMEDEEYIINSPATVFVPKGVRHKSEVVSGTGMFICVTLQGKYSATL